MTKEERFNIINEAYEFGLTSVTIDGVKYEWQAKKRPNSEVPDLEASELIKEMSPFDGLSEEDILYWSSPHYDTIQAEKELKAKHAKEQLDG